MDTRGIEVTNQLRSAIRAKLMELGVRYDEELPDYILVMVVNKKSRQQMHDDLNLFLEDCTTTFVDWLHDQVLKKLQKVTVAKKKSSREFVPTVVVKQEEERKKRKISATSFLEDQTAEQSTTVDKPIADKSAKVDKADKQLPAQKQQTSMRSSAPDENPERSHSRSAERSVKGVHSKSKTDEASSTHGGGSHQDSVSSSSSRRSQQSSGRDENPKEVVAPENSAAKTADTHRELKASEAPDKNLKRSLDSSGNRHDSTEKRSNEAKRPKPSEEEKEDDDASSSSPDTVSRKLKSCVNKPRITSVVSVKTRLGISSPRKKFENYREREGNGRYRPLEKRFDRPHRYDNGRGGKGRNFETDDRSSRRNRDGDSSRYHETAGKVNDVRGRIESSKNERPSRNAESRERVPNSGPKADVSAKKSACTIKDRLGSVGVNSKAQRQSGKSQETADYRNKPKSLEQAGNNSNNNKNIKDRLGPLKSNFRPVHKQRQLRGSEDDESLASLNPGAEEDKEMEGKEEEDEADNDEQSLIGPVKSHIVAVNRSATFAVARTERKRMKMSNEVPFSATQSTGYLGHGGAKSQLDKLDKGTSSDVDEDTDDTRLPSKVIVTPRPLKPLQPTQKRATQSLLLRAVAEANQSVVRQKNPEPSLFDKKPVLKRLKPAPARDVSQNLSVHFNSSKRLVMEKIQVELNTLDHLDAEDVEHEPYVPQPVTDEHMGVVMSLFQRSDDKQKFLVTLNGYNNNLMKEKISSEDDDERLEMEVNEDDELALLTTHNEATTATTATSAIAQDDLDESEISTFRITDEAEDNEDSSPKETSGEENNENCNTENMDKTDEMPRKRRKLSPIIYNRSHSPSPTRLKSNASLTPTLAAKPPDKKPLVENTVPTVLDKSREKCRYWPNCTLGNKCAYLHPPVMCSVFPACKFGDKCAYKHPKCKFGLSCTKLGCVFSHPAQQCKYHPFCTKPACPYSHPVSSVPAAETTSQRAKFTWRRRD